MKNVPTFEEFVNEAKHWKKGDKAYIDFGREEAIVTLLEDPKDYGKRGGPQVDVISQDGEEMTVDAEGLEELTPRMLKRLEK